MAVRVRSVIMIAVSLMVIALILPLGLGLLGLAENTIVRVFNYTGINESAITLADAIDPSILTLLTVLIPILAVIGIAVGFITLKD